MLRPGLVEIGREHLVNGKAGIPPSINGITVESLKARARALSLNPDNPKILKAIADGERAPLQA